MRPLILAPRDTLRGDMDTPQRTRLWWCIALGIALALFGAWGLMARGWSLGVFAVWLGMMGASYAVVLLAMDHRRRHKPS